jgi:hypothetical protein
MLPFPVFERERAEKNSKYLNQINKFLIKKRSSNIHIKPKLSCSSPSTQSYPCATKITRFLHQPIGFSEWGTDFDGI